MNFSSFSCAEKSQEASKKTVGGQNFDAQFETPNADQIKRTVYASWDGADFSDRIWANKDKLLKNLKATLKDAVIQGYGAEEVSRRFAREMGVHFNNALRLIRTETNRVLNETTAEQLKKAGAKFYRFVAIMDSRTSPICAALYGKVFPFEKREIGINAPPMHPNCRSTIVLDDGQKKAKDGESGDEIDTAWIDDLFRDWVQDVTKEAEAQAASQKEAEQIIEAGQSALKSATAANVQRVSDLENEQSAKKQNESATKINRYRNKITVIDQKEKNSRFRQSLKLKFQELSEEKQFEFLVKKYKKRVNHEAKNLISTVQQNGKKIAPEKVIAISELGNDEIIWLESGDEKAGLQHILKHGNDLRKNGIAVERLPEILIQAPLQWEIVERNRLNNGGVALGLKYKNKFYKMIIGGNGYIVTFYPDKRLKNQI